MISFFERKEAYWGTASTFISLALREIFFPLMGPLLGKNIWYFHQATGKLDPHIVETVINIALLSKSPLQVAEIKMLLNRGKNNF